MRSACKRKLFAFLGSVRLDDSNSAEALTKPSGHFGRYLSAFAKHWPKHFESVKKRPTEDQKNDIWNAFKTIPTWQKDIVADIRVTGPSAAAASAVNAKAEPRTYTVKSGDTLSKIAKQELGDGSDYMKIFEANRDQLTNPDLIKPGQVLRLP